MDMGDGTFVPMRPEFEVENCDPQKHQMDQFMKQIAKQQRMFHLGEELTIKGSRFRVRTIGKRYTWFFCQIFPTVRAPR